MHIEQTSLNSFVADFFRRGGCGENAKSKMQPRRDSAEPLNGTLPRELAQTRGGSRLAPRGACGTPHAVDPPRVRTRATNSTPPQRANEATTLPRSRTASFSESAQLARHHAKRERSAAERIKAFQLPSHIAEIGSVHCTATQIIATKLLTLIVYISSKPKALTFSDCLYFHSEHYFFSTKIYASTRWCCIFD